MIVTGLIYEWNEELAFLAINKAGEAGAFAIQKGFQYAITTPDGASLVDGKSLLG